MSQTASKEVENVIIVGSGPAGLAAALYTARAHLKPLVFGGSPPGGQLTLTSHVENYPGFESILGQELIQKQRDHALKFETRIIDENVTAVDFSKRPFSVTTVSGIYQSHAVIVAVGASALWLGLESETRLRGKGVSACATCDGFFFKDKVVGVVGGGDTAMEEALYLTRFASKVYVFHRRDSFKASKIMQNRVLTHEKIEVVWNTQVTEVLGQNKVEGVKLQSQNSESRIQNLDGLFLAIGHRPDTKVFADHIALDEKGYIITADRFANELTRFTMQDSRFMNMVDGEQLEALKNKFELNYMSATSVPGVFAAGDCVDFDYRQAGTASGMGIAAALDAERWLEAQTSI